MANFKIIEHLNSNNSPFKFNAKELDATEGKENVQWTFLVMGRACRVERNYYYGARYGVYPELSRRDPKFSIWLSVDPLAESFPSYSPYNFTMNNPLRFIDPDRRASIDIIEKTKKDVEKTHNDLNEVFAGDQFTELRGLITRGKRNNKKQFDKIDGDALSGALSGFKGDDLALAQSVTDAINSDDKHIVEFVDVSGNVSTDGTNAFKSHLDKTTPAGTSDVMIPGETMSGLLLNSLSRGGLNILRVSRNDISSELQLIVKYFEWEQKNSNVNLKIIKPDSYYCHFDRDILEKVVFNILSNAFKYTPFGGLIEIELKPIWKNNLEYIIILVKDNGKGIPQEDKRKIFERHFHGKERSSSGIGLHLAATLVNAHKGEINVSNSSLGGTEFMITLPVSSKAFTVDEYLSEDEITPELAKNYIPGEVPTSIDVLKNDFKEKVLIVEDDHDLRRYLKNIIMYDYKVFEASNGKEGLEVCLKEIPDIVITDIMMPEVDGIELCKLIKQNILVSHIPVLMLTAKTGDEFSKVGLQVGAWDYIPKPFNSYQLLLKIKNILNTRNSFRQLIIGKTNCAKIKNEMYNFSLIIKLI